LKRIQTFMKQNNKSIEKTIDEICKAKVLKRKTPKNNVFL